MMLLLKLRNRCVVFLRRCEQPTSTDAAQRASCKDAAITACLSSISFLGGVFVIVAVIYAANSSQWIDLGVQSPGCYDEVHPPASHIIVEAASPRPEADIRGSPDVRVTDTVDPGKTSSNMNGSAVKDRRRRCAPGHVYIGAWTICATYDTRFHSCGKTSSHKDASDSQPCIVRS